MPKPYRPEDKEGVYKSLVAAYAVLLFHVFLLVGLGLLVVFFSGIIHYMPWIFLGGAALLAYSGYRAWNRARQTGKGLTEILSDSRFSGRPVEISFMGGFFSLRLGSARPNTPLPGSDARACALEDPETIRARELAELARLFERDLITEEEFIRAKRGLFEP